MRTGVSASPGTLTRIAVCEVRDSSSGGCDSSSAILGSFWVRGASGNWEGAGGGRAPRGGWVLRARVPVVRVGGALLGGGTLFFGGVLLFVDIGPIVHESPLADVGPPRKRMVCSRRRHLPPTIYSCAGAGPSTRTS